MEVAQIERLSFFEVSPPCYLLHIYYLPTNMKMTENIHDSYFVNDKSLRAGRKDSSG